MKILLIGTGSIANRHLKNIVKIRPDTVFYVYSRSNRTILNAIKIYKDELFDHSYDLVIIASESDKHDSDLEMVLNLKTTKILLEKPASLDLKAADKLGLRIDQDNVDVRIGYDLRYHDGIRYLKDKFHEEISLNENIIINSQVGQNLRTWRESDDNFESYSFEQSKSGGVINDLSHELDFINYITNEKLSFSKKTLKSKFFNKNLEDIAFVSATSVGGGVVANFELNCISHYFYRLIIIHTKGKTYSLNLINGEYLEYTYGKIKLKRKFNVNRDSRYKKLWKDLIDGPNLLPSYNESINILKEIQ
ncbi:Gfo/Idh/MocA family oxidoreductase [Akkermansiaceae bacterium]|nr:Gfo/Idh/MocA family oxidoreductase [Akkermansiaceae bacterium]